MNLISIMQNIELSSWLVSTEVIFISTSMSIIFLVMSLMLSNIFSLVYSNFSSGSSLSEERTLYFLICSVLIFLSFNFMFIGKPHYLIASIVIFLAFIVFNLYIHRNIKLALSKTLGFTISYFIGFFIIVDYFDSYNATIFLAVSMLPILCLLTCKKVNHFDIAKLTSGFIVFLSIAGYSYNIDRVLVSPSIADYHKSISKDLKSGLDYKDLSNIYAAEIKQVTSDISDIQILGLRNNFSALPISIVQSKEIVKAQGQYFEVTSANHPTVIYSQAKISALMMMLMPCFLWLLTTIFIGIKHHTGNTIQGYRFNESTKLHN